MPVANEYPIGNCVNQSRGKEGSENLHVEERSRSFRYAQHMLR